VLADITRRALKRWLGEHGADALLHANRLFSDAERQDLADALAATNATANLLGRSRVRLRLKRYQDHAEAATFSDPTPFEVFDDEDRLVPLTPAQALEFFRRKVPLPGVTAEQLTEEMNRQAFTLAVDTDAIILGRVQDAIRGVVETGREVSSAPRQILDILESAGIQQTVGGRTVGGAYAENVFRTNMMESYRAGAQQELAEVADDFPVWRYVGIRDGRQRPAHAVHFDQYYPTTTPFNTVRDSVAGKFDGYQCRCDFIPIYHGEWVKLRSEGARIADGHTDPVP